VVSNAFVAKRTTPLLVSGAVLHVLPAGSQFDSCAATGTARRNRLGSGCDSLDDAFVVADPR